MSFVKRIILLLICSFLLFSCFCFPSNAVPITLRVGVNINTPPLQYVNDEDEICGLYIDIMNAIAEDCSFDIEYIPFKNTRNAMGALEAGEVNAVLGVVSGKYQTYQALYTDELYTTSLCLVSNLADKDGLRSGRILPFIVLESDTIDHRHLNSQIASSTIMKDNQNSAFAYFCEDRADIFAGIKECAIYLLEKEQNSLYSITSNYIAAVDHCIAVHKEDRYVYRVINQSLANLHTTGRYESIVERWVIIDKPGIPKKVFYTILWISGGITLVLLLYVWDSLRVKRLLRTEVALRTSDLNETNQQLQISNNKLEKKLKENEEYVKLLDDIVEFSSSAMMLFDQNYKIVHKNKYSSIILQVYEKDINLQQKVRNIFRLADQQFNDDNGSDVIGGKTDIDFLDGTTHTMRYNIHLLPRDGTEQNYLLSVEDITVESVAQAAEFEREKNHALNNMITGLAHEIKNPLASISAAIGMVKSCRYNDDFIDTFNDVIPHEVERINRLVQNLISYAKPPILKHEDIDFSQFLYKLKASIEPYVQSHGIILEWEVQEGLHISASKDRLNQIILNLILNSVDSIKDCNKNEEGYEPKIRLIASQIDSVVLVSVWDNGSGMNSEQIKKCTQPFYTTKIAGTGLGLAVSSQYITELGGTMHITSELGVYTKVNLFIPS